jgi:putative thioredoxin
VAAVPPPPPGGLRGAIDLAPLVARQNQQAAQAANGNAGPAAAGEAPAGTPGVVVEIGDAEFPRLIELSRTVPVVVALVATWSTPSQELVTSLRRVIESAAGRLVLAIVDSDANPQVVGAFQAESIPTVVAVIAGSPVPLFAGLLPEDRMIPLFEQVLELAAQNGVTGTVPGADADAAPAEPEPEPLPPLHQEAYAAIDRQDYAEAARLFRTAIAQDPRDSAAVAALAQVELLDRLRTIPDDARTVAADAPKDVAAALRVADLDVAGGHVDDAFDRLLDVFATASGDDRTAIRTRLLDYFALTGVDDPRVGVARRRLAMLLY